MKKLGKLVLVLSLFPLSIACFLLGFVAADIYFGLLGGWQKWVDWKDSL